MTLREIAAIGMYRRGFVHGLKFSCKDCGRCEKQAENAKDMAKVCRALIMWDGCRDASICDIVEAAKVALAKASGEVAK